MNTQRLTQITVGIVAIAILAVIVVNRVGGAAASQLDLSNQPVSGNPEASVQVAMFKDFLCPHCATFSETIFPQLKSEFAGNDDVAFYFVDFVVMPGADAVAAVAECVYQQSNEAFWDVYPVLMRSQAELRGGRNVALDIASEYGPGIDRDELVACSEDPETLDTIRADGAMAAAAGATGTPSIFVNGQMVTNSASAISSAVNAALR